MSLALTDRKTNPETYMHPKSQPMRGNQLGEALANAGLIKKGNPNAGQGKFVPTPIDEPTVLRDVRAYLARLVAGDRMVAMQITTHAPTSQRAKMVRRLKDRGLLTAKEGNAGGVAATQKLVSLAHADVDDEELRRLVLTDLDDEEWDQPAPEAPEPTQPERLRREPVEPLAPMPRGIEARNAEMIRRMRAWLYRGMDGEQLRISRIAGPGASNVYAMVYKLRDAGYVERQGEGVASWYTVPEKMHSFIRSMTDEQLAAVMWPGRAAAVAPMPMAPQLDTEESAEAPAEPALDDVSTLSSDELLALVARRWDQVLTVLERMDARFARLERELSLPAIEQETGK